MNGRERLNKALNHIQTDRPPLDLGSSPVTGAHVSIVHQLRQALGLPTTGDKRVKVHEPSQLLGFIEEDLLEALGCDCIGLSTTNTSYGWRNEGWKNWTTFDGTPCQVPALFNTEPEPDGRLRQWAHGDRSFPASAVMPAGGYFFDAIVRQPEFDPENLKVEDNLEDFGPIADKDLEYLSREAERLYRNTPYGIVGAFGGTDFGNVALVPAPWLKHPKGIRDLNDWYMSTLIRREHIYEIFAGQCEIALKNLEQIRQAIGNKISVIVINTTDFGMQNAPFLSSEAYRYLYYPFHKRLNDWVHQHTTWKTFSHSCGSIMPLIPDFIDAGFDILNPVQCTACGMDPRELKAKFGDQIVFWGGAVDTQSILPFGTPEKVAELVRERIEIFGRGGGFVTNSVHNIQAKSPIENVLAYFEAVRGTRTPAS